MLFFPFLSAKQKEKKKDFPAKQEPSRQFGVWKRPVDVQAQCFYGNYLLGSETGFMGWWCLVFVLGMLVGAGVL
jgi:hypothetical protein